MSVAVRRGAVLGSLVVVAVLVMAVWQANIRGASATSQPTPAVRVERGPAPVLSALTTLNLKVNAEPQFLGVSGRDLTPGMTMTLSTPDDLMITYGASVVDQVTPTTARIQATLELPGTYALTIRSRDGAKSNDLKFSVKK